MEPDEVNDADVAVSLAEASDPSAWLLENGDAIGPVAMLRACVGSDLAEDRLLAVAEWVFGGGRVPREGPSSNPCDMNDRFADVWLDLLLSTSTPTAVRHALGPTLDEESMSPGLAEVRLTEATDWFSEILASRNAGSDVLQDLLEGERFVADAVLLSRATSGELLDRFWSQVDEESVGWGEPILLLRNPNVPAALAERVIDVLLDSDLGEELAQVASDPRTSPATLRMVAQAALRADLPDVVDELRENESLPDDVAELLEDA